MIDLSRIFLSSFRPITRLFVLAFALVNSTGCTAMEDQPRYQPLQWSTFFPDARSARPVPPGAIAYGALEEQDSYYTGMSEDEMLIETMPVEITIELLERGRERYDIFCSPCHGLDGYGQGIIVQRGFPAPQSFHTDRLRQVPDGHFYNVITNGFGRMFPYDYRVPPDDRWAITAYIRVLQFSQQASLEELPAEGDSGTEGNQP
jgi:Cytochrome C oxidase, cbb3-type, subunit III